MDGSALRKDAPSGPSMGIFLRHIDFLSANGARARPWQNTGGSCEFYRQVYIVHSGLQDDLFIFSFDSLRPINNLSVKQGRVFLG